GYTEIPDEYQEVMDRLLRKHTAAKEHVPAPIIERREGATFGVVTIGGCDLAVREALEELEARGVKGDYLRVRGFPFGQEVERYLAEHEVVYVIEQNRDAQLRSLLVLETSAPKEKLRSIRAYGGFPLQAAQVVEGIGAGSGSQS
ncbi:MAG: 2-oxoacid:acceptor oxidoreductase subunit alpha, partial [Polyangiaceae bacterium]